MIKYDNIISIPSAYYFHIIYYNLLIFLRLYLNSEFLFFKLIIHYFFFSFEQDKLENEQKITQSFSLDNSKDDFSFGGRFLLRISTKSFVRFLR